MGERSERVGGTEHALDDISHKIGGHFVSTKDPPFIGERLAIFEELFAKQEAGFAALPRNPIEITLPDGNRVAGTQHQTSPLDVAMGISPGLSKVAIVAKISYAERICHGPLVAVDDDEELEEEQQEPDSMPSPSPGEPEAAWQLWDLSRPLEGTCQLKLLTFDDEEGRIVFSHSSAHILGQALEDEFGALLTIGPPLDRGFYYDCYVGEDLAFNQDTYKIMEAHFQRIVKASQKFIRLEVSKEQALAMFQHNPFKVQLISRKVPNGGRTTVYRCGNLVDLCMGPHLPDTGRVKAFSIERHSAAYWLGKTVNDSLQRLYAVSFPDAKLLKEDRRLMEAAKKRDHRLVGANLGLFFFEPSLSPGSAFFLPAGTRLYNKLCDFIRCEYRIRGFQEVISPNVFSSEVFRVSGHLANFKKDMFIFKVEGRDWGMKPMNCPGHCLMFRHIGPSYRQLPLRLADFGVLHRNEATGSLSGLTRVRRFQQDDAHIFCRMDQVTAEVAGALDFLMFVYRTFGFEFEFRLATRPKKALGGRELWDKAEAALAASLDALELPWKFNPGDGAFYGPKIDIRLKDALKRWHQCGTIQLDFQLPRRFNLQYRTEEIAVAREHAAARPPDDVPAVHEAEGSWEAEPRPGFVRPVMIHRAILGSVERMLAVILEHTGGKLPFWLSPIQALVCPISDKHNRYATAVYEFLHAKGYAADVDRSNASINKKVRDGQLAQWNYILVVGAAEEGRGTVTVRPRDHQESQAQQELTLEELLRFFESQKATTSRPAPDTFHWEPKAAVEAEATVEAETTGGTVLSAKCVAGPEE